MVSTYWNPLTNHRQLDDVVGMGDRAAEHGIGEAELEARGWSDPADGRAGAAKHCESGGERSGRTEVVGHELIRGAKRADQAFLVEDPLLVDQGEGAHSQCVPVRPYVVQAPELTGDRFRAQLLGNGDRVAFDAAIGV